MNRLHINILLVAEKLLQVVVCGMLCNGPFSGTTQVSRYQKGKTNLDFTEARDSEWQWQTDNHTSTPPLTFLQAGCPSCRPTNSVKALKGRLYEHYVS